MARVGGGVLVVHTDDWPNVETFLAVVAEWCDANRGFHQRVAALGGYLTSDIPANMSVKEIEERLGRGLSE